MTTADTLVMAMLGIVAAFQIATIINLGRRSRP